MPPATIEAFRDHGVVAGDTVKADYAGAHKVMEQLAEAGIDMEAVTQELLDAGVKQFADSYDALIRGIAEKVDAMSSGYSRRQHIDAGAGTTIPLDTAEATAIAERIWHRDPDLWKPGDAAHAAVIRNRLGWLDIVTAIREPLASLTALTADVRSSAWAVPASARKCCEARLGARTASRPCTCSTQPIRWRSSRSAARSIPKPPGTSFRASRVRRWRRCRTSPTSGR
jgi:hypothetical protein